MMENWHSCKFDPPLERIDVLTYDNKYGDDVYGIGMKKDGRWWPDYTSPKFWMYLPEPPK